MPHGKGAPREKEPVNVVAEMMNWEQRCNVETDLQTQWGVVWGGIFARGKCGEGGSGTIEQQIAAKERELIEADEAIRQFDLDNAAKLDLVRQAEAKISTKEHRMKKNTELTPAL